MSTPFETSPAATDANPWLTPQRLTLGVWLFVAFGVALRLLRYLLRFPIWEDEAFLAYNLMNRDFIGLLAPTDFQQVAPIGYLWLQRAVIELCGFSEYSLRLTALILGIGGLFLFRRLAILTLGGWAQLCAVAIFAVSYPMIRYSAEAKQYGFDLFLSMGMLWAFLEWRRAVGSGASGNGWLLALTALVPFAVFLSHPAVFIGGALSIAWFCRLLSDRSARGMSHASNKSSGLAWFLWFTFGALLCAAFGAHLSLATKALGETDSFMTDYWGQRGGFPPVHEPLKLLPWLLRIHAGSFLAYPAGAPNGGSSLTLLAVLVGLYLSWRGKTRLPLLLALAPLALHLVAAALQRFPYGGEVKFSLYWAPLGVLLAGAGFAAACAGLERRLKRSNAQASRAALTVLCLLIAVGLVSMTRDFLLPAKTRSDQRGRDFARWFWFDAAREAEVVCLHSDLHRTFDPEATHYLNWLASYAVNQRIYSPRHAQGLPPHWDAVGAGKPLWCVEYRSALYLPAPSSHDEPARQAWLKEMSERYTFVGHDRFPLPRYDRLEHTVISADVVEVYRFVAKPPAVARQ